MKNLKSIFALLVIGLIGLSLTGCGEDDLDTNQYKGGVSLNAYGPNPVMRGGMLRFVGSNLDQIASIEIPGVSPITSIDVVKAGIPSEIRITVPKDGPTEGIITLTSKSGEVLNTVSTLAFEEPIEIVGFSPASAMPGEVIKIEGDYLNLIHSLAFADGVIVREKNFESHDRYAITVKVPEEAKTGKLELYTADLTTLDTESGDELEYQILQTEKALEIGVPTTSKIASPRGTAEAQGTITAKAGETITISGTYYNMVQAIMAGGYLVTELNVSDDGKAINFTLPAEAGDGEIMLVCKSSVEVPIGTLVTVKPTNCVATPNPVKAGQTLQIDGNDMEVVVDVIFADSKGEFVLGNNPNIINTIQAYAVTVPEAATEGNLKLAMANGELIDVPFTLVKPVATGYDNATVSAGGVLTIQGNDLDLVKKVQFGEGSDIVEIENATSESVVLTIPMNAKSGKPTLILANGASYEAPELNISEALFCYATALPAEDAELKAGESLTLNIANGDKLTGVQIDGNDCQFVLVKENTEVIIAISDKAKKGSKVRLISSNGEITYTIDFIPNTEVTTVLWTGAADLAGWSWNWQIGDGAQGASNPKMFAEMDLQEGDVIRLYLTAYNDWWQVQFFDGHWGGQTEIGNATGLNNGNNINSGIYNLAEHDGAIEIPVTATLKEQLTTLNDWGYCWILQGEGVVVTKIAVTHYTSLETTVWTGEAVADDWGNQPYILSDGGIELLAAGMKIGSIIRVYITPTQDSWNCQIVDGHWGPTFAGCDFNQGNWNLADHNGALELTVDEAVYNAITTVGGWGGSFILNGDNVICTKVTIE